MIEPTGYLAKLTKLFRFAGVYGWQRAISKTLARLRPAYWKNRFTSRHPAHISVIGCGQFAFSTVCFFLRKAHGNQFLSTFDTNPKQAESLGRYYGFRQVAVSADELLDNPALKLLYVVSNHASHTPYAIAGLLRNVDVFIEKPIAVTRAQLVELLRAARQSTGQLYAGYNRPYARAIQLLRERINSSAANGAFSLSYVINGHQIPPDHWYRNPGEGTRICGNLGHWIDLTIHLFAGRGLPTWIDIQLAWANPAEPDDNLSVTITTDQHDLVSMMLTARSEPFEGVSESICLQYNDLIARIDDFRSLTIWQGPKKETVRFSPKDVGHQRAVLQPFCANNRSWHEVEVATLLTLHISDMAGEGRAASRFVVSQAMRQLAIDVMQTTGQTAISLPP